jgi:Zn-dependent protease
MITKKEILAIVIIVAILSVSITLMGSLESFLYTSLSIFLILTINIISKKIIASSLESEIEIRIWEINRYGFKKQKRFGTPFLAGAILPLISAIIFQGTLAWMASLVFDVRTKISRASKKHGLYSFSEMTEWHIGLIALGGIAANLFFALLGYLVGMPQKMNFTFLTLWFVFFNMLPISDLDGNKIFFGNYILWSVIAITILMAALLSIVII